MSWELSPRVLDDEGFPGVLSEFLLVQRGPGKSWEAEAPGVPHVPRVYPLWTF